MAITSIAWCDKVWNPVTGCTKISAGCKNCYAAAIAKRFWGERQFSTVICHADRLDMPRHWHKPARIFVNSMSDLFHPDVPDEFIREVFSEMYQNRQHTFIVLTKRPERMQEMIHYSPDLGNHIWLGVTAENQQEADRRIPILLQTQAVVRFVSVEPMLDAIYFKDVPGLNRIGNDPGIGWVICGSESGPGARWFCYDWARSLRDQCQAAEVPFFFKQGSENGKLVKLPFLDGKQWMEFPV
jgi:protein gp37